MNNNDVNYFDSFAVEHIPKEIKEVVRNKNIKTNIFRIQALLTFNNVWLLLHRIYWFYA